MFCVYLRLHFKVNLVVKFCHMYILMCNKIHEMLFMPFLCTHVVICVYIM